jgi:hypothetical protein
MGSLVAGADEVTCVDAAVGVGLADGSADLSTDGDAGPVAFVGAGPLR